MEGNAELADNDKDTMNAGDIMLEIEDDEHHFLFEPKNISRFRLTNYHK